jgi:hypothetical protein
MTGAVAAAVDRGDLDALVRLVDGLAAAREWEEIVELRDRCRHALERGLQLWPAAEYAEYRLALEAPPSFAGPVVTETAGRFALGPLWEVAASTHDWASLAPHLPEGPARTLVAHERVLRGEDLRGDRSIDPGVLELPLVLEPWEPSYPVATYGAGRSEFPSPPPVRVRPWILPPPPDPLDDLDRIEALLALAAPWAESSNGTVAAIAVAGGAAAAVAALNIGEVAGAEVSGQEAVAWMAWMGASGGAFARRRGGALGRFGARWALSALAGEDWPASAGALAAACDRLRWHRWEPRGAAHGWSASLAIHGGEGVSWALYAADDGVVGDGRG